MSYRPLPLKLMLHATIIDLLSRVAMIAMLLCVSKKGIRLAHDNPIIESKLICNACLIWLHLA